MAKINQEIQKRTTDTKKSVKPRQKFKKTVCASTEPLSAIATSYDEESGILTVYDAGEKVWQGRAEIGAAYTVSYDGKRYRVNKSHLPHRKNHLLMWLFGYDRDMRFDTDEDFTKALESHRNKRADERRKEYIYSGPGFAFAMYTEAPDEAPKRICAWVDPEADRRLAKKILSIKELNIAAMQEFYGGLEGKLLIERFGFRDKDFEEVNKKLLSRTGR